MLPRNEAAQARAQISVAAASGVGKAGHNGKIIGNGIDRAAGDADASALAGDAMPNTVKLGPGLQCKTVSH